MSTSLDKPVIKLIYKGGGFIPGVPARDLTEDEVKAHGGVKALTAHGLYQEKEKPAVAKETAKDGK
jgi:hypothetical protein